MLHQTFAAFWLCVGFGAAPPPTGAGDTPVAAVPLPGGGIADQSGNVGYFPNLSGGIDALDLANGKLLWSSKEAKRPLLATGNRLFAQAGVDDMRVVVLDAANAGKRLSQSRPLKFLDWVSFGHEPGRSLRTGARLEKDTLLLVWEAKAWYAVGAAPTPEIQEEARKSATGAFRVDLKSGMVESVDKAKPPKPALPEEPASVTLSGRTFTFTDSTRNPTDVMRLRRTIHAKTAAGKVIWARDVAGPPNLLAIP